MTIRYISRKDIDTAKWDACIRAAKAPIYNQAAFLDEVSSNWDALVAGDYEAVMPLPWRQKWGIKYIYPPAFTQQLGISSANVVSPDICDEFIRSIPKNFRSIEINGQASNTFSHYVMKMRRNHVLSLAPSYSLLENNYSRSARRNIRKALDSGIKISEQVNPAQVIAMHRNRFKDEVGYTREDYTRFESLSNKYFTAGKCICLAAFLEKNMIASGLFFRDEHRIYFVLNGNTKESLEIGAAHLLMDHIIRKFAGSGLIMDFEGSDHESFARFYLQYGAVPELYPFIHIDRLPLMMRIARRLRNRLTGK